MSEREREREKERERKREREKSIAFPIRYTFPLIEAVAHY